MSEILLKGIGIRKYFPIKGGVSGRTLGYVHAVDDVNITITRAKRLESSGSLDAERLLLAESFSIS